MRTWDRRNVAGERQWRWTRYFITTLAAIFFLDYFASIFYVATTSPTALSYNGTAISSWFYLLPLLGAVLRKFDALHKRVDSSHSTVPLYYDRNPSSGSLEESVTPPVDTDRPAFFTLMTKRDPLDELILACQGGDEEEVTRMIDQGVLFNRANKQGMTPLAAAFWSTHVALLDRLMVRLPRNERPKYADLAKLNRQHFGSAIRNHTFLSALFKQCAENSGISFRKSDVTNTDHPIGSMLFYLSGEEAVKVDPASFNNLVNGRLSENLKTGVRYFFSPMHSIDSNDYTVAYVDTILAEWFRKNDLKFIRQWYQEFFDLGSMEQELILLKKKYQNFTEACQQRWRVDPKAVFEFQIKDILRLQRLQFAASNHLRFFSTRNRWESTLHALEEVCHSSQQGVQAYCHYLVYVVLELEHVLSLEIATLRARLVNESGIDFISEFETSVSKSRLFA